MVESGRDDKTKLGHQERGSRLGQGRGLGAIYSEAREDRNGKLLWSDEDRETLLGLLLENVGADRAVQLGDPEVWRAAVAKLSRRP